MRPRTATCAPGATSRSSSVRMPSWKGTVRDRRTSWRGTIHSQWYDTRIAAGFHARWPVLTMVSGTVISCEVSRSRGERPSRPNASGYGGGVARAQLTVSAQSARTVNWVIELLGNRVIEYQITRLPNYPMDPQF